MGWDPIPGTWNPKSRTQDLRFETQDPDPGPGIHDFRSRTNNPDSGLDICYQGSGSIWSTIFTILTRMILVILKYSLQINVNINSNFFK